jgi:PAS domain-containing protein
LGLTVVGVPAKERATTEGAVRLHSDTERLSLALAAAKLGDWSWDAATDVVTFSERAAKIFQIPPGPHMTWTSMRALLHADDAERAGEAVARAIRTHTDYDIEYRLINGTGERWVSARGRALYDQDGGVVGMLGVIQEITAQVRTREALRLHAEAARASEERYRAFIQNSSEGIWRLEFDPPIDTSLPVAEQVSAAYANGRLAECNAIMARMYGLQSPEDLVGKTLDSILPSSDPGATAYLASIAEAGYRVTRRRIDRARRARRDEVVLEQHHGRHRRWAAAPHLGVTAGDHRPEARGARPGLPGGHCRFGRRRHHRKGSGRHHPILQ